MSEENQDYLKSTRERSLEDDSKTSEAELHAENEGIKDAWQRIQDLKAKIAKAKQEAIQKVNEQFAEELKAVEGDYALMITLTR